MAEANPGWRFQVTDAEGNISMPVNDTVQANYEYKLYAGETYTFEFWAYDKAMWDFADGYIGYTLRFAEGKHEEEGGDNEKVESAVSDEMLTVGVNSLTLDASAITTVFEFEPSEVGTYTFSAPGGIVGNWGSNKYFLFNPNATSDKCEWTCQSVGQSVFIGVSGADTLTVTKSGNGGQASNTYDEYVNVHTPAAFTDSLNNMTKVDVKKAHSAVLGNDGYYHLDSADGPILYMDMRNNSWNFVDCCNGAFTMRGVECDASGSITKRYEFLTAMKAYAGAVGPDGYYPLTQDLITFVQCFGNAQGWWTPAISPFSAIKGGNADADTQWMVLCYYEG